MDMGDMRKNFYSVTQENGVVGIRLRDGYEVLVDGVTFHAYRDKVDGDVYIIDMDTGLSVFRYEYTGRFCEPEEDILIEMAKEELLESGKLENWGVRRTKKSYLLAAKMFRAYLLAERLRGKQEMVARSEKEENYGQGNVF